MWWRPRDIIISERRRKYNKWDYINNIQLPTIIYRIYSQYHNIQDQTIDNYINTLTEKKNSILEITILIDQMYTEKY